MKGGRRVTVDEALAVWTPSQARRRKERVCWNGAVKLLRKLDIAACAMATRKASLLTCYQVSSYIPEGDFPLVFEIRVTRLRESEVQAGTEVGGARS